MPESAIALYHQHYVEKDFERIDMFRLLVDRFGTRTALYPGSFVHVSPSLVIPSVTYVDSDRRCPSFFADPAIQAMVEERREYPEQPDIRFIAGDYATTIPDDVGPFDLLISQWAGPVSQVCKRWLRAGGILLANDSHVDASLAQVDPDYQLVAVLERRSGGRHLLSEDHLDAFFLPKSGVPPEPSELQRRTRPPRYTRVAAQYLFRRRAGPPG